MIYYTGNLCNLNSLIMCSESGDDVPFGEDAYYKEIIQKDSRGYDFELLRYVEVL